MANDPEREPNAKAESAEDEPPVIDVADWFRDHREVWLELDGVRYRLRITRRKKLILQK